MVNWNQKEKKESKKKGHRDRKGDEWLLEKVLNKRMQKVTFEMVEKVIRHMRGTHVGAGKMMPNVLYKMAPMTQYIVASESVSVSEKQTILQLMSPNRCHGSSKKTFKKVNENPSIVQFVFPLVCRARSQLAKVELRVTETYSYLTFYTNIRLYELVFRTIAANSHFKCQQEHTEHLVACLKK